MADYDLTFVPTPDRSKSTDSSTQAQSGDYAPAATIPMALARRFLLGEDVKLTDATLVGLHKVLAGRAGSILAARRAGASLAAHIPGAERMSITELVNHPAFEMKPSSTPFVPVPRKSETTLIHGAFPKRYPWLPGNPSRRAEKVGQPKPLRASAETAALVTPVPAATPAILATVPAAPSATAASPVAALSAINVQSHTEQVNMLQPWRIFASADINTDNRKKLYLTYKEKFRTCEKAEKALRAAKLEQREKAQQDLEKAQQKKAAAAESLKAWIVEVETAHRASKDDRTQGVQVKVEEAKKKRNSVALRIYTEQLKTVKAQVAAEFRPDIEQALTRKIEAEGLLGRLSATRAHHQVTFPDGQVVFLHDHVDANCADRPEGLDNARVDKAAQRQDVQNHITTALTDKTSGIHGSMGKVLAKVSKFEGGFDTINTFDKAHLTWGFLQWTGGKDSDLTTVLKRVKSEQPQAFQELFCAYGIDCVREAVITSQGHKQMADVLKVSRIDGTVLVGKEAADFVSTDPTLLAVMVHAGRDERIKKAELKAAADTNLVKPMATVFTVAGEKIALAELLTSEREVAMVCNSWVHCGMGTGHRMQMEVVNALHEETPRPVDKAKRTVWNETLHIRLVTFLLGQDSERARGLYASPALSGEPGSFKW